MRALYNLYLNVSNKDLKNKLVISQILISLSALVELGSFLFVIPIIGLLTGDEAKLDIIYAAIGNFVEIQKDDFIVFYIIAYVGLVMLSTVVGILSVIKLSRLVSMIGVAISSKLLGLYLGKSYADFTSKPISHYNNFLVTEIQRLQDNILQPIAQINARLVSGLLLLILLVFLEPYVSLFVILLFVSFYYAVYTYLKPRLFKFGSELTRFSESKISSQNNAFKLFKEVKIYDVQERFVDAFHDFASKHGKYYASLNILYNIPRFLIDGFIYLLFALTIILSLVVGVDNSDYLTTLFIFGLAAIKLLPIFQSIYSSLARIRGSFNVVNMINNEYEKAESNSFDGEASAISSDEIQLSGHGLAFSYESDRNIINNVNVELPTNGKVALIGKSGSGKTTLVDLLSGLLMPSQGAVHINGKPINSIPKSVFGYVPQNSQMINTSVIQNVAFGVQRENVDMQKVYDCIEFVGLTDVVSNLSNGYDSIMSSDGYGLSGGQLQRLAIARCLYMDTKVIILDEPTSALDIKSEKLISNLLNKLAKNKLIIIIAHRLETIKDVDKLILLDNGVIAEEGSYDAVVKTAAFRKYSESLYESI